MGRQRQVDRDWQDGVTRVPKGNPGWTLTLQKPAVEELSIRRLIT